MSNEFEHAGHDEDRASHKHTGMFIGLIAGLAIALAGMGYLVSRVNQINTQMAQMQDNTQSQIAKLGDATTTLLEQRMQSLDEQLTAMKGTAFTTAAALKRAAMQAQKRGDELSGKLEEQQKQVSDEITQLKDATTTADSKISAVSTDVGSVKTDVTGVRSEVASTQANLEKTGADLKKAIGDMGVLSGLIATNAKDLAALRELGERNYYEFTINKKQAQQKVGDVTIALKKSDPGRNRYTVEVLADDKRVEKKDRTINEPVQIYVGGRHQPYEIVVNQVKRDEIVGYLSTPKVRVARQ